MNDVVIVGAGVNGLVAAIALARSRRSVVLIDQRPVPGGAAVTTEFAPGYRAPTLSHALGPLSRDVSRALRLDRAGLEILTPDPALTTLGRDGRTIVFHRDPVLTAASINQISAADAARWKEFVAVTQRLAAFMASVARQPPPPIDRLGARDRWRLLTMGRRARALGRTQLVRLARWTPMAVADLTGEWFENDLLQAAIAGHAVFGHPCGPWSAGTGGLLLQRLGEDPMPVGSGVTVRGGPGALGAALAKLAADAGVSIRLDARVDRLLVSDGRVSGVAIEGGDEIAAQTVVGAIDPKALIDLAPASAVPPSFAERMRHVRSRGVTAKINLALSAAPVFTSLNGDAVPLRGRLLIAPDLEYIERAFDATKYGEMSESPWLEISLPSMIDPSLASEGRHVMSVCVHFTPRDLRGLEWNANRDALFKSVMRVLDEHAPGLSALIVAREILTPEDLEHRWGFAGGHIFHGERALDQSWVARPLLGWARYEMPIAGLYLASSGAHPGGGLTGLPGWLAAQAVLQAARYGVARKRARV